jgi:hypothetical protein
MEKKGFAEKAVREIRRKTTGVIPQKRRSES